MLHQSWLSNEVGVLKRLTEAGAQVPKTYAVNGNAILMDYLGTRQTAASTLNHVTLAPGEARALFDQVVGNIRVMLRAEVVHGDLSAYNILYWQGPEGPDDFLIIDFPQATNPWKNPNSRRFFSRDVARVCEYFAGQGVHIRDFEALAVDLWQQAYGTTGDLLS